MLYLLCSHSIDILHNGDHWNLPGYLRIPTVTLSYIDPVVVGA